MSVDILSYDVASGSDLTPFIIIMTVHLGSKQCHAIKSINH